MKKHFSRFGRLVLVIVVALPAICFVHAAPTKLRAEELSQQELTRLQHEARHRQRRIIVNNDGCDTRYGCKSATAEDLLAVRTSPLVGTQVDTIFYCTNGGFNLFWHNTKVAEVYTSTEKSHKDNKMQEFLDRGLCPLRIIVDFCRANNIEIFWSLRMNDIHDSVGAWFSPLLYSQFKKDHPELLVCDPKQEPKKWGWAAVNYKHKEVRDQVLACIREVCENYDIDGIELDYFRHLIFFKSPAAGHDASREELDSMTELVREVRKTVDEAGRRRGRPILVAVRAPDSLDYCRALGLDVERWMKEDLIDLFIPGGDFCLNPWQTSVELGHRYGIPVYPCLSRFERNNMLKPQNKVGVKLQDLRVSVSYHTKDATDGGKVIDVGSNRELFVDEHLIDRLDSAPMVLHHPRHEGAVMKFDKPWEGIFSGIQVDDNSSWSISGKCSAYQPRRVFTSPGVGWG